MPAAVHAPQRGPALLPSGGMLREVGAAPRFPAVYPLPPVTQRSSVPRSRRLLHVRNGNCKYHLGEETFKLAQSYMDKLAKHGHQANKAALYGELCALLFAKSHYDEVRLFFYPVASTSVPDCRVSHSGVVFRSLQAYRWCIEAMKEITPGLPVKVVVDVLRQASKVNARHVMS